MAVTIDQNIMLGAVVPALVLVFLACLAGVQSRLFDDTLTQRIGLAMVAIGALAEVSQLVKEGSVDPHRAALYVGLGLYSAATAVKIYRSWRAANREHRDFRCSTDFVPDAAKPPTNGPA